MKNERKCSLKEKANKSIVFNLYSMKEETEEMTND
jgi:hypothetical protein